MRIRSVGSEPPARLEMSWKQSVWRLLVPRLLWADLRQTGSLRRSRQSRADPVAFCVFIGQGFVDPVAFERSLVPVVTNAHDEPSLGAVRAPRSSRGTSFAWIPFWRCRALHTRRFARMKIRSVGYAGISTYDEVECGAGMASPSSLRPSRWNAIASFISRWISSFVPAVATHPGRSGE